MSRKNSELKARAREAMTGFYSTAIIVYLLIAIVTTAASNISSNLFGETTVAEIVTGQIFSFIISLITSVFTVGMYAMYLDASRGKKPSYASLVELFQKHPDRVILVSLVIDGIGYLCLIPALVVDYQVMNMDSSQSIGYILSRTFLMLGLMCAGSLVAVILTIPFAFSYYLLIDREDMQAGEALKTSLSMMKGNYGRYIKMLMSFIGLYILSIFSFGLGLLWVAPYMQMTQIEFYRDLRGELEENRNIAGI